MVSLICTCKYGTCLGAVLGEKEVIYVFVFLLVLLSIVFGSKTILIKL